MRAKEKWEDSEVSEFGGTQNQKIAMKKRTRRHRRQAEKKDVKKRLED